ncbi:MAG: hypothetical protein O2954_08520 [bacterium]|nr:hypothetical protein [bacterium]
MAIDFTVDRWEKIREDAREWWSGELKRPLIQMTLRGRDPGRSEPVLPAYHRTAFYDFSVPAEDVVDRWDYELSCVRFLGDAFPARIPDFGPGVLAAFVGAKTEVGNDTVWFKPRTVMEVGEVRFEYDADNPWYKRVRDLMRAALVRWEGLVQVGMTDLGGEPGYSFDISARGAAVAGSVRSSGRCEAGDVGCARGVVAVLRGTEQYSAAGESRVYGVDAYLLGGAVLHVAVRFLLHDWSGDV